MGLGLGLGSGLGFGLGLGLANPNPSPNPNTHREGQHEAARVVGAQRGARVRPRVASQEGGVLVEERLERDEEGVRPLRQELAVERVPRVRANLEHEVRALRNAREGPVGPQLRQVHL